MSDDNENDSLTFEKFAELCSEAGIEQSPEEMELDFRVGTVLAQVTDELHTAMTNFPVFNSAHEGYAVLAEEVDELWDHVKMKQGSRDIDAMRKEAVQIAAMAIRFATDICHDEKGNN
jgi:hypothetical protein